MLASKLLRAKATTPPPVYIVGATTFAAGTGAPSYQFDTPSYETGDFILYMHSRWYFGDSPPPATTSGYTSIVTPTINKVQTYRLQYRVAAAPGTQTLFVGGPGAGLAVVIRDAASIGQFGQRATYTSSTNIVLPTLSGLRGRNNLVIAGNWYPGDDPGFDHISVTAPYTLGAGVNSPSGSTVFGYAVAQDRGGTLGGSITGAFNQSDATWAVEILGE